MVIKVKKLSEDAILPHSAYPGDACCDLHCIEDLVVEPGKVTIARFGLAFEIPEGYEGQLRPRSGLSQQGLHIAFGTVDANFRGEVKASLSTFGPTMTFEKGARIAQLAIRKTEEVEYVEGELSGTVRGERGYGSSGV